MSDPIDLNAKREAKDIAQWKAAMLRSYELIDEIIDEGDDPAETELFLSALWAALTHHLAAGEWTPDELAAEAHRHASEEVGL